MQYLKDPTSDLGCIMRESCRVLYGFMMLALLASACAGVVTAAEIEGWETDNIFVVIGSDYATYYEFDFDASTVHAVHFIYRDIPSVDAFEQVAQVLIDTMLGTNFMEHKVTHVDIKGEYGSDALQLHQVIGEDAVLTTSPKETGASSSDLTETLTGMVAAGETGEWSEDNKFTIRGDDYRTSFRFDFDASTVDVDRNTDSDPMMSVDAFTQNAQAFIDSWLDTSIAGYKVTSVSATVWCESADVCEPNVLSLKQKSGTNEVMLDILKFNVPQGEYYDNVWFFDVDASTAYGRYDLFGDSLSVDAFNQYAQALIDSRLDTSIAGYKVTSIEVVGAYESERLVLRQESGNVDIKDEYGSDALQLHQVIGEDAVLTTSAKETGVSFSELTKALDLLRNELK